MNTRFDYRRQKQKTRLNLNGLVVFFYILKQRKAGRINGLHNQ